ncbi:unnamed protein product, partial [Discosporangium mesarthrocarpum]
EVDIDDPSFAGLGMLPLQNIEAEAEGGEGVSDMCSLNHLHEAAILYNLRTRFLKELPYTYTGEICIAINPYKWLPIYGKERGDAYHAAKDRASLAPHVYATSAQAYKGMRDYNKSQSILVSGESGAGKTETVKILLNHLASIAGAHANDRTIEKVVRSNPLLESFGNAKTLRNDNSSRFGKFTELQFDARSRLYGSKSSTYLLEKVRVVSHAAGERSYHVFYQLLSAPEQEKARFALSGMTSADFHYTAMGGDEKGIIEGKTDGNRFTETCEALNLVGVTPDQVTELFSTISGVLHLGQIEFDSSDGGHDGCAPRDPKLLQTPAKMLGVEPKELGKHLTHRTMKAVMDLYEVPLSAGDAGNTRDGLAKEVYFLVFDWLVGRINDSTRCPPQNGTKKGLGGTVDLLDIFGFESFIVNSFEQLCINYANEKLQQKFTQDVFKDVQVEYKEQGIPWSHIDFTDNAVVLAMIEEPRKGLLPLLDEECMLPKGTDEAYTSKAVRSYKDHPNFSKDRLATSLQFSIAHYAGEVIYDTLGFVEKNRDQLHGDLLKMLSLSTNKILRSLFVHPPEEDDEWQSNG